MTTAPLPRRDRLCLLGLAGATAGLLLATLLGPYGYFIDEFYYLACARHPALGYVDHPPLAPLLLALVRSIGGESLLALRVLPAVCAGATVYVTGLLAHRLGGGRFAVCLAGLGVAVTPCLGTMSSFYSMNAIEPLVWASVLLCVAHIAAGGSPRLWLVVGALLGVGFLNKHTIVVLVAGLGVGIVATPIRRHLRTPWPWLGAGLALLVALPNIGWQMANAWPSLAFYRAATALKNLPTSPLGVLLNTLLIFHPLLIPVWGTGALALLLSKKLRTYRALGIAFWTLLVVMMASRVSRPDRIAGLVAIVFSAGAVVVEARIRSLGARIAVIAGVLVSGALFAPLSLPILSFEATARYAERAHATPQIERGKTSPLPQWLADRTGWEDFRVQMERVWAALPPRDRDHILLFASDYGHAGALERWGPARGFPRVIAPHNSYWHWSVGHTDSEVLIAVGPSQENLRKLFAEVERVDTVRCSYCMSWRNGLPIHIARRPIVPLSQVWPRLKHYE